MADDKKNGKDAGDRTQQQPLRPPMPKLPQQGQPEGEKPAPSGGGERTVLGAPPPAMPKPPTAPAPAAKPDAGGSDRTVMVGGAPAMPKPGPAGAHPAPPPAARPTGGGEEDEGATVILSRATEPSASLQRLQPPGHGADIVKLTQESYVMGRSRTCDIQLYSTTASRQHARIVKRGDGWYLEPEAGKTVVAGGSTVKDEVRLVHKMRLLLGGDELLFFDESAAIATPASASIPAGASEKGSRTMLLVGIVVAVLAAAAAAAWLLFLNP